MISIILKVCTSGDEGDDQLVDTLNIVTRKLTPALLIISEIFLLLTFILHAIVPEFRKQLFGGCPAPEMKTGSIKNVTIEKTLY